MFSNDLELLIYEVSLLLGIIIIVLQSRQLQGCHFLTSLIDQTFNSIHSWYRMVFVELIHGGCCHIQIQLMANTECNHLINS